ncbi:hypothetical protein METBIDRAFT_32213 [Metschnikowia bicuspidata var. bicuspidata NRRL YB-4993]|uniref:Uncharacterized protein n=1 Tax=Metschnikowia bicuspidata var. bicuspidata NRRL YB-4993 TaxID=869754 RepID=A0A1A0HCZ3_9ASCO|nr:hypothetical protein METBIDRAFT_32213 [Metschnikowia bicuspidata var. bicuspidata NRRL YB-4993]OBA21752.1 hypothetical protein METBIDRAFT_32213 [Metschnikowia bicuspidata var. bicuspidata NRRL YB-4993]
MSICVPVNNGLILRSLFRDVIRGLRKISDQAPILIARTDYSTELKNEIEKASIDKLQYRDYLLSEIRHTALQKFSAEPKDVKDHVFYSQLWQGHHLATTLRAIQSDPNNAALWVDLIDIVVTERTAQLRRSNWILDYKSHKEVIDEHHLKEMHPLQAKRVLSKKKKMTSIISPSTDKGYKLLLKNREDNAAWVVRNYLKRLQLQGKIPNPFKLPHVSDSIRQQALQLPRVSDLIPGSTKSAVLKAAYDMDHINTIIKPEIEYLLNKRHYLEKYQRIVNKDGPVKVKIISTLAGIMQAHFLRAPVKDEKRMKQLAIDVKKLTRVIRKQFIWKLDSSQAEGICERKFGDGYAVRGSKGFSIDEIMYPKRYYEEIVLEEAEWEFLIKVEELKMVYGSSALNDAKFSNKLREVRQQIIQGWHEPLDTASREIDDEVKLYFTKYKITENSSIWERRAALQARMNLNFEKTSKKLGNLIGLLERDKVCAHSDLFHRSHHTSFNYGEIPEKDRIGTGKSLGDYLKEAGLSGYKMGYEFKKRLNIA